MRRRSARGMRVELREGDRIIVFAPRVELDICPLCGAFALINRGWGACDEVFGCSVRRDELARVAAVKSLAPARDIAL